jgi:triacylglycerol lipase
MSTRHLVDPELLPMLEMIPPLEIDHRNLAEVRAQGPLMPVELPPGAEPEPAEAPARDGASPVPLRIFIPKGAAKLRPAILQIHGGGYVLGSAEMSDVGNHSLAAEQDAVVVSVDYRLAPETPFPGPLEDCYAGLEWLASHAADLGVDPSRIMVFGQSAGGGLAAALALLARDRGGPKLAAQFLVYPMIDHRTGGDEDVRPNPMVGEFLWTRPLNRFGWSSLRGEDDIPQERLGHFSPALAQDLAGLPPAYVATGALDLFLEEDVDYALRLIRAGVPTDLHVYPGAFHAFDLMAEAQVSKRFATDLASAFRQAFAGRLI